MLYADALLLQTNNLISNFGQTITLFRPGVSSNEYIDGASGGQALNRSSPPEMLTPKPRFFGLVQKRNILHASQILNATATGDEHDIIAVLVGLPADDIRYLDYFQVGAAWYEVRYIEIATGSYETRAECVGYAG